MSILFVFILNMIFVSYVRSDALPGVACAIIGTHSPMKTSHSVEVSDIPERCKIVIVGEDFFDDNPVKEEDAKMAALKKAGKMVYIIYECPANVEFGPIISDPKKLDAFIAPMLAYLQKNNIEGVILGYLNLGAGDIPDYANKINSLISKIKQCLPSIKIGLYVDGNDGHILGNKKIFDYSLTNPNVDFYLFDLWKIGASSCDKNTNQLGGRQPINSDDPSDVPLELVCSDLSKSPLDKSKLVVYVYDLASRKDKNSVSYTEYCSNPGKDIWCVDTTKILYDKITYLKNNCNFKGLMIQYLDMDDMTNACGCGKFPVANTYIDAWEGKAMTPCPKFC